MAERKTRSHGADRKGGFHLRSRGPKGVLCEDMGEELRQREHKHEALDTATSLACSGRRGAERTAGRTRGANGPMDMKQIKKGLLLSA